jgi:DNA invertase Pin-like site-specific DNA recombinase
MKRFIAYYRVSTDRQRKSGLGLEAQQATVTTYIAKNGQLLAAYQEAESGRKNDRPELAKALAHARRTKSCLLIAKWDRLSRNAAFLLALVNTDVEIVACDCPFINKMIVGILAVVAEWEAEQTGIRTKDALKAYKARGGKLGTHDPRCKLLTKEASAKGRKRSIAVNRAKADEAYADLVPIMLSLKAGGESNNGIARHLNSTGHETRNGKPWNHVQVGRVLDRALVLA